MHNSHNRHYEHVNKMKQKEEKNGWEGVSFENKIFLYMFWQDVSNDVFLDPAQHHIHISVITTIWYSRAKRSA